MPQVCIPRHCQPPEVSSLATGSSRTGWPPGGEGEGKAGFQWGGRGLLGQGLEMTPISLQGDPGPPGKPVSDAAQRVNLCLPQPWDREPWAAPSTVPSASPSGSQRGRCWRREGNPTPAVSPQPHAGTLWGTAMGWGGRTAQLGINLRGCLCWSPDLAVPSYSGGKGDDLGELMVPFRLLQGDRGFPGPEGPPGPKGDAGDKGARVSTAWGWGSQGTRHSPPWAHGARAVALSCIPSCLGCPWLEHPGAGWPQRRAGRSGESGCAQGWGWPGSALGHRLMARSLPWHGLMAPVPPPA